jgi:N-acetylglutamate synthase-like GNAT family acetyltransferase
MNLLIREAIADDSEYIAILSRQLGYNTTETMVQYNLNEIIKDTNSRVFVAEDSGKVIGWIHGFHTLRIESGSFIEIGGMCVEENYRKKGIGGMLVKKIIEWSESIKKSKIRVRCSMTRKEAHLFYASMGFLEVKEQIIFDLPL